MIPTDSEFSMLYFFYGVILLLILYGLLFTPNNKEFRYHLIFYSLYAGFMVYVFNDKENFNGGASLVVLFYGFVFPIIHLLVYGIIKLIKYLRKNKTKKTV